MAKIEHFKSALLIIFLLVFFSSFSLALTVQDIESSLYKGCNFSLSLDDWRVVSAIGLLISAILIAGMYMYGSVIDKSFKEIAKNEFFQLFFTVIIFIFFAFIVQLLCSDIISDIFGFQGSSYSVSFSYLSQLSSYLGKGLLFVGVAVAVLNPVAYAIGKTDSVFSFLSEPVSYLSDSIFFIYGIILTAYILTLSQINLLLLIPTICLMFLIPIGLILRSFLPFRRFGGALLGAGIGLFLFIPLSLIFNNALFNAYINDPIFLPFSCTDNSDCFSHICEPSPTPGLNVCKPLKADNEICTSDDECRSGYCKQISQTEEKRCSACGLEGSDNPICCEGYAKGQDNKCHLLKLNGEQCISDNDCISGLCREQLGVNVCVPKKKVGEECVSDRECISRSCVLQPGKSVKTCKQTILNPEDRDYFVSLISKYGSVSYIVSISESQSIFITDSLPLNLSENLYEKGEVRSYITSIFQKIIDVVVITFIAGIVLPILNITLISRGVRDLSSTLGSEMDIASIWKIL